MFSYNQECKIKLLYRIDSNSTCLKMEHTKPPKALHRRHEMLLYIYLAKISYSTSSHFKGEEIEMSLTKNDDRSNTGQNMKESELSR